MRHFLTASAALVKILATYEFNATEWWLLACVFMVAFGAPGAFEWLFRPVRRAIRWLTARPWLAVCCVGLLAFVGRAALLLWIPRPVPVITDEFSHLLLADTIASGRLTNPTHAMWRHFESIHIIQRPTYNSMYLPGQGLILAAGEKLWGDPWMGVLVSTALMCAACCWMLQGWLPPRWSLLGGCIVVARWGLFSYWVNSYWGGAVPALGGALALGSLPRMFRHPKITNGLTLGLGVGILAISRPYEGGIVAVAIAALLGWWIFEGPARCQRFWLAVAPAVGIVLLVGGFVALYCERTTGSPFKIPYEVNRETYGWPTTLPWLSVSPMTHAHKEMHDYFDWERGLHAAVLVWPNGVFEASVRLLMLWGFYAGPLLTISLLMLPVLFKGRRIRFLVIVSLVMIIVVGLEQSSYPHYLAPAASAVIAVLIQGLRHWNVWRRRKRAGAYVVRWIPVAVCVLLIHAAMAAAMTKRPEAMLQGYLSWWCTRPGNIDRAKILAQLSQEPGRHLVIVRYGPTHSFMYEWVYNAANIDSARVVWARDMGSAENKELVRYFAGRRVWVVNADDRPLRLSTYAEACQ